MEELQQPGGRAAILDEHPEATNTPDEIHQNVMV
jgi:hypothetical protein